MTDQRGIEFGGVKLPAVPRPPRRPDTLDKEGLHVGEERTITTWSGLRVDPQNMRPFDIDIADIAHSLARQCRYNGHTAGHLSVARHCLWVADRLALVAPELELWGLLHDAGEAYLGDMVRPVKHSPEMRVFREAEDRLDEVIARRFNLTWPMPVEIHDADAFICVNKEMPRFGGARYTWLGSIAADNADYINRFYHLTEA